MEVWEVVLIILGAAGAALCAYLIALIKKLGKTIDHVNAMLADNKESFASIVTNIDSVTDGAKGTVSSVTTAVDGVGGILSDVRPKLDDILVDVGGITKNAGDVTAKVSQTVSGAADTVSNVTGVLNSNGVVSGLAGIKKALSYAGVAASGLHAISEFREMRADKKLNQARKKAAKAAAGKKAK